MKSKVMFTFIALFLAFMCAVPAFAAEGYTPGICDKAGILTDQEEADLLSSMSAAGEKAQVHFYVYTRVGRLGDGEHEDELFREFPNAYYEDSLLLVVEKNNIFAGDEYYYWLYTYGDAYSLLSDYECDEMLDNSAVYSNLKGGRIFAGAERFISISADKIAENREAKAKTAKTLLIVLPIVFGVAAGGIAVGIVVYKYKRKLKSAVYPLSNYATLNLTHAEDKYITSSVTRTRVASSSSGGRSGGGGGGGSRGGR